MEEKKAFELKPVKTVRTSEAIYDEIRGRILSGELKEGDRLPSERKMMEMLQRSRPSIREALRMLERSGLIRTIAGSGGAIVLNPSAKTLTQPLESMVTLNEISSAELAEYRELNEVASCLWAAQRRTEEELKAIEDCMIIPEDAMQDFELFGHWDMKFHSRINDASHNRMSGIVDQVIHRMVLDILRKSYEDKTPVGRKKMLASIQKSHLRIFEAIRDQDEAAAQEAMREHLRYFESDIQSRPAK